MNKNLSFGWTILEMVYHSKGIRSSPHSAPSATNRKQGIVSVPYQYRPNADHLPLAQNRPIPHCREMYGHTVASETFFRIQTWAPYSAFQHIPRTVP